MHQRRSQFLLMIALIAFSSVASYWLGASGALAAKPGGTSTVSISNGEMQRMEEVMSYVERNFVEPISEQKLTEGALRGIVAATNDKYSTYFNEKEFKAFVEKLQSSFTGIGVHVDFDEKKGLVTVVAPIKGSPGEKAGLRAGDAILEVDGKSVAGMSLDEVVNLIRGPKGTEVKLSVRREGEPDPLRFTITRETIQMPSIEWKMIDKANGIGYIQLREFTEQIGQRMNKALEELQAQGMKRLVLDLRNNPGGLLDEAVNVASIFVPAKQPVVHTVGRDGTKKTTYSKAKANSNIQIPLVVLVDSGSASASEIVAGAIKDLKLGTLVGVKTFGKGSVQSFFRLPDGSGMKLTTAKYLTAGEKSINGVGIEPDVKVENEGRVLPGDPGDKQMAEALKILQAAR
jgi:carboxyl-terminal processing protease